MNETTKEKRLYDVPVRVAGTMNIIIAAEDPESAMKEARRTVRGMDCRERLHDMHYAVDAPAAIGGPDQSHGPRVRMPDGTHGWGIEYNHNPADRLDGDAKGFILAASQVLLHEYDTWRDWFWQNGNDTKKGYQFFEYSGDDPEHVVHECLALVRKRMDS